MLCSRCRRMPKGAHPIGVAGASPQTLPGWERLELILCSRCGVLLPGVEPGATLLDKLAGLARFGLAAGTSTILEP